MKGEDWGVLAVETVLFLLCMISSYLAIPDMTLAESCDITTGNVCSMLMGAIATFYGTKKAETARLEDEEGRA